MTVFIFLNIIFFAIGCGQPRAKNKKVLLHVVYQFYLWSAFLMRRRQQAIPESLVSAAVIYW